MNKNYKLLDEQWLDNLFLSKTSSGYLTWVNSTEHEYNCMTVLPSCLLSSIYINYILTHNYVDLLFVVQLSRKSVVS